MNWLINAKWLAPLQAALLSILPHWIFLWLRSYGLSGKCLWELANEWRAQGKVQSKCALFVEDAYNNQFSIVLDLQLLAGPDCSPSSMSSSSFSPSSPPAVIENPFYQQTGGFLVSSPSPSASLLLPHSKSSGSTSSGFVEKSTSSFSNTPATPPEDYMWVFFYYKVLYFYFFHVWIGIERKILVFVTNFLAS